MCRASASTMTSMRCLIALRLTTCLSCCKRTREVVSSSPHATAPNGPGGERGSTSAPQRRFSCGLGRPRTIAQISTLGRVGPPLGTSSSTRSTRGTGRLLNATPPHTAFHTHACPLPPGSYVRWLAAAHHLPLLELNLFAHQQHRELWQQLIAFVLPEDQRARHVDLLLQPFGSLEPGFDYCGYGAVQERRASAWADRARIQKTQSQA